MKITKIKEYLRRSALKCDSHKDEVLDFEKEHPELQKQWVGLVLGFYQYASGFGVDYFGRLVAKDDDNGFKLKGDVRKALSENDIRVGKMEVVDNKKRGWDILIVLKVPEMIAWMKENKEFHRFNYSGWLNSVTITRKEK